MASPIAEFHAFFTWFHHSSASYTGGFTTSVDFNLLPGDLTVHTGLSRVVAASDRPLAAAVGIVEFQPAGGRPVTFNLDDAGSWIPQFGARTGFFTVGFYVVRADMTCWVFFQAWR